MATWYEPGLHVGPDGGRIFATDRELHFLDARAPNPPRPQTAGQASDCELGASARGTVCADWKSRTRRGHLSAVKNSDDALFETYLQHANVAGYYEREARAVWALYKQLTDSKPLKDATRDDGRKVVAHFEGQNIKSATIKKDRMVGCGGESRSQRGDLDSNPFSSIVPERDDKQTRLPLNEADIKNVKANLDDLDTGDQVLFRLLATTV